MFESVDPTRHAMRQPSVLIGRKREQALLSDRLMHAINGHGNVVLVSGEAGIGKTTLVCDLIEQAEKQGILVLTGGCYDLTTTPPYGPWIDALWAYTPAAGLPALPASLRPDNMADDGLSQAARFDRIERFFAEVSEQQPLVLVLEDLHWADAASLDLLRYLARRTGAQRLLLAVTCRDDDVSREQPLYQMLPILVRESHAMRIDLRRLDANAISQLLEARYRLAAADQRRLIAYLDSLGGGNPLYIEELLRTLEADGLLHPGSGDARLADLANVHVPPLLQHVISRRLSQLSAATRDALAVAAVIGQDVPINSWSAVSGLSDEQLADIVDEAVTAHVLEEQPAGAGLRFSHALVRQAMYERVALPRRRDVHLRVAEILVASSHSSPDMVAYHFKQAGDMRAVEWFVRAGLRARRSAAWFNAAHSFEAAATLLAADDTRTREYGWLRFEAGFLQRFSGDPRSIDHMNAAEQSALVTRDPLLVGFSRYARGSQRCMRGDVRRGLRDIEQGVAAIDRVLEFQDVPGTEAQALVIIQTLVPADNANGDQYALPASLATSARPRLNHQRGILINWLGLSGRYREAIAVGEPFVKDVVAEFGDEHLQLPQCVNGHRGLGHAYAALGRPDDARREYALAQTGYRDLSDYAILEDTIWTELIMAIVPYETDHLAERSQIVAEATEAWNRCLGLTVATVGEGAPTELPIDMVEGRWSKALQMARDHLSAPWIALVQEGLVTLGTVARHRGEFESAWECVTRLLPQGPATEPGDSYFAMAITGVELAADLSMDAGDLAPARRWIETHGRWLDWSGARTWQADNQLLWARFHECSGDLSMARQYAERALTLASDPCQPLRLVAAHRMLGSLDRQEGHYDRAEAHLGASVTLADACAAPFERALSLLALAELRIATQESAAAQTLLDEARALCHPLAARPTLERIATLEVEVAASGSAAPAIPDGLTAREVEVLRLVAAGKSNRQIANALFLSPRTVERHIANIYLKVDVHSKAEATAYARRHNLA